MFQWRRTELQEISKNARLQVDFQIEDAQADYLGANRKSRNQSYCISIILTSDSVPIERPDHRFQHANQEDVLIPVPLNDDRFEFMVVWMQENHL